jgi:hypothetical protein
VAGQISIGRQRRPLSRLGLQALGVFIAGDVEEVRGSEIGGEVVR